MLYEEEKEFIRKTYDPSLILAWDCHAEPITDPVIACTEAMYVAILNEEAVALAEKLWEGCFYVWLPSHVGLWIYRGTSWHAVSAEAAVLREALSNDDKILTKVYFGCPELTESLRPGQLEIDSVCKDLNLC